MTLHSALRGHILMTTDAVGGVWTYSSSLARELARRGWTITLATLGPAPRQDQLLPLRDYPGIRLDVTDLVLEWQDPEGKDQERCARHLAARERRLNPDVVHLNGFREALAGFGAPVLVVAHSCVSSWWRACRDSVPDEPRWLHYATQTAAGLNAADCWVAPTQSFRTQIEMLHEPDAPGLVIANGIDAPITALGDKQPFILAAGRLWDEAKNIAVLPEVARDLDWPLRIAGALHEPGLGPRSVPLHGNLEWLGELSHSDLLRTMGRASIFVSPARYEPFGLTVLEAAASGCALVLADIPTFRELWGGAALFADPRDAAAIRRALQYLSSDADLRNELAAAALLRAAHYSLAAQADAYEALYCDLIAAAQQSSASQHALMEATA